MKHIKKFKLYESPDEVFNQKFRDDIKDSRVYYKALGYMSDDALSFGYNNESIMKVTKIGSRSSHFDIGKRKNLTYSGRLWYDRKIITFWDYPEDNDKLIKIMKDIEDAYLKKYDKKLYIINNINDWFIEIGYDNKTKDIFNKSIIIPIIEYKRTKGWTKEQKAKAHVANWKEKEKLKKQGFYNIKNFGSDYYTNKLPNDMSQSEYRDKKTKYKYTENYIIKTFEDYDPDVIADTTTMNNVPVKQYVDLDYFGTDIEKDETEPPNATGRNDRETKNKTKKSVYKKSVS